MAGGLLLSDADCAALDGKSNLQMAVQKELPERVSSCVSLPWCLSDASSFVFCCLALYTVVDLLYDHSMIYYGTILLQEVSGVDDV